MVIRYENQKECIEMQESFAKLGIAHRTNGLGWVNRLSCGDKGNILINTQLNTWEFGGRVPDSTLDDVVRKFSKEIIIPFKNEEESRFIQRLALDRGIKWSTGFDDIITKCRENICLKPCENGYKMRHKQNIGKRSTVLTIPEFMEWVKGITPEPKFKPYQYITDGERIFICNEHGFISTMGKVLLGKLEPVKILGNDVFLDSVYIKIGCQKFNEHDLEATIRIVKQCGKKSVNTQWGEVQVADLEKILYFT